MVADSLDTTAAEVAALHRFQRRRRILVAACIAIILPICCILQSTFPPETIAHEGMEIFGAVLICIAIVGRLWCMLYIGGNKSTRLVATGPYSMCRNPLYFFSSVAAAGIGVQAASMTVGLATFLLCATVFHFVARREEFFLLSQFGPSYRDYVARVPRFFPDSNLFAPGRVARIQSRKLLHTFLDGLVFFVAMPLFEGIEWAQGAGVFPVVLQLP